jgi:hypothetical protein
MKKLNKLYSFHISDMEKKSINVIRDNEINVSRFLRFSLRNLEEIIQRRKTNNTDHENCLIRIRNKDDLKKYAFLMEDIENERTKST